MLINKGAIVTIGLLISGFLKVDAQIKDSNRFRSFVIQKNSFSYFFPYLSNKSLGIKDSAVEKLVFIVHGNLRKPETYFSYAHNAIIKNQVDDKILLIAPYFATEADIRQKQLSDTFLTWSSAGWKKGDRARSGKKELKNDLASMEVIDSFLTRLTLDGNYPFLKEVILIGHSAGAQFVQRYAAINRTTDHLSAIKRISFRFFIMNPSSYLYMDERRPVFGDTLFFDRPDTAGCSRYNIYKYGLERLNAYASLTGKEQIQRQYLNRDVTYLIGSADTTEVQLDQTCEANLQGRQRLERGELFFEYLKSFSQINSGLRHQKWIINGIGHDCNGMMNSDRMKKLLFE